MTGKCINNSHMEIHIKSIFGVEQAYVVLHTQNLHNRNSHTIIRCLQYNNSEKYQKKKMTSVKKKDLEERVLLVLIRYWLVTPG